MQFPIIVQGKDKPVPSLTSARMQRWVIALSAYQYRLKYRKGKDVEVEDALFTLLRPTSTADRMNVYASLTAPLSPQRISLEKQNAISFVSCSGISFERLAFAVI